ncbi:MAG: hypothetical protein ABL967_12655 [Bryobacteraceae bacterium]
MSSRTLLIMFLGLAVVGALIFFMFGVTTGAHLRLEGRILKVRTFQQPGTGASLVFVDFRVSNPSDVSFMVDSVKLRLEPANGEIMEASAISKADTENVFRYLQLLGPKYNDVLAIRDKVVPHESVDRMAGARFEVPEAVVDGRRALHLVISEVDGAVADLTESK